MDSKNKNYTNSTKTKLTVFQTNIQQVNNTTKKISKHTKYPIKELQEHHVTQKNPKKS